MYHQIISSNILNTNVLLTSFCGYFCISGYNTHETLMYEDFALLPFRSVPFYTDQTHLQPELDPIQSPSVETNKQY